MSTLTPILFAATLFAGRPPTLAPDRVALETPPPLVAWKDLGDRPIQWLGRTVRMHLQFSGRVATWNPYMTRFGTGQFAAFQAWTDEQFPWIKAEYDAWERGPPGRPVRWRNPDRNHYGEIVAEGYYDRGGSRCRDFIHTVWIEGRRQQMRGTACRNPDGTWTQVS